MVTLFVFCIVGFGLYRIAKFAAANPGACVKAGSMFKSFLGK